MKSLAILMALSWVSAAPFPHNQTWCQKIPSHGSVLKDLQGNFYVMDDWQLRRFRTINILSWYRFNSRPVCTLSTTSMQQFKFGQSIDFRPDQDFHQPMYFRSKHQSKQLYLWYRGKIHPVNIKSPRLNIEDRTVYRVSRIVIDSLNRGQPINNKTIMEGTLAHYNQGLVYQTYIYTRNGLRPIDQRHLSRLNIYNGRQITLNSQDIYATTRPHRPRHRHKTKHGKRRRRTCRKHRCSRRHQLSLQIGPLFKLINKPTLPTNILIRGSHPKRIYLLKNGKRYFFWSRYALLSRELQHQAITELTDDELYLIPYGGNLY